MSERTFTIEMIDMDLADLDADEFLGLTPTYLRSILLELKRCYDLIDAQKENLEFLNGAIEKLHEETWTEAAVEFVVEHHPSKWCDYTHCWKCEEETTSE